MSACRSCSGRARSSRAAAPPAAPALAQKRDALHGCACWGLFRLAWQNVQTLGQHIAEWTQGPAACACMQSGKCMSKQKIL